MSEFTSSLLSYLHRKIYALAYMCKGHCMNWQGPISYKLGTWYLTDA